MAGTEIRYAKHYIPLESDPEIFTGLLADLGATRLAFVDAMLDPPKVLDGESPVLALILAFPTTPEYDEERAREKEKWQSHSAETSTERDSSVIWFRQTINNACGLYALLHAVSNGGARQFIDPNSFLDELFRMPDKERIDHLEKSSTLDALYKKAALQGETKIPDAETEIDAHYICFVSAGSPSRLYRLDGDSPDAIDCGIPVEEGEDLFQNEQVVKIVEEFVEQERLRAKSEIFNLLALCKAEG